MTVRKRTDHGYGGGAGNVGGFFADHFLIAPLRPTRADRMCRVEEISAHAKMCLAF